LILLLVVVYYYYSLVQSQIHFVKESSGCFYWGLLLRVVHEGAPECNCIMSLCADWKSLEQMWALQWVTGCDCDPSS